MPRVEDNKLLEWPDVKKIETSKEWDPEAPVTGKGRDGRSSESRNLMRWGMVS